MMRGLWFWAAVLAGSGLSLALYWLTDLPLGIPGEWTWGRFDVTPDLVANGLMALIVGAAYLAFVAWGYRRLSRRDCSRRESCGWLIGLGGMAGLWIWTVLGTGATGPTVGRWPFVLYYPSSSGYFYKARYEAPEARRLLQTYEDLMKEGDVLHVGTHPPGLFLVFHGLIGVVRQVPAIVAAVNATQPGVVREAFDVIHENSVKAARGGRSAATPLTPDDRAVLWLAGLISFALTALTVWPLYGLARESVEAPESWLTAAVWPLVPAAATFLPKSDVAFAFLAMLVGWLWLRAWRSGSLWIAGLAGAVWTAGILCSLAFLPVGLWLALVSLLQAWPALRAGQLPAESRRAARTIIPAALVSLALLTAISAWGDIPLAKVYWLNYQNHAGFYLKYPRGFTTWLAVNPLELAGGLGAPIFLAAGWEILRTAFRRHPSAGPLAATSLATAIVWLWLWLSGKNSGEAARLWLFLMPYVVAATAVLWQDLSPAPRSGRLPPAILLWFACQELVCFGTVQRVNGFPLD